MAAKGLPRVLWEDFLDRSRIGLFLVDAHQRLQPVNPAARDLLGRSGSAEPIPPEQLPWRFEANEKEPVPRWPWERLVDRAAPQPVVEETLNVRDPWQRPRTLHCHGVARDGIDEAGPKALLAIEDWTAVRAAEEERGFLLELLDALPDYIGIADTRGGMLYHNRALYEAQGQGGSGSFLERLAGAHDPESFQRLQNEAVPNAEQTGIWRGETRLHHRGMEAEVPVEQFLIAHRDEHGAVVRYSTLMRDLSQRYHHESEIERLLYRDPITGLPNRMLFHDRIEQAHALQEGSADWLAVIVCDIKEFSAINESLGQDLGDEILAAVGRKLRELLPQAATIGRMGGDQFGVLLPWLADAQEAMGYAERIVDKVGNPLALSDRSIHLSLRAGISVTRHSGESAGVLVEQADAARQQSKRTASRCQFFSRELTEQAREQVYLTTELRRALDSGGLAVHYQPQVDLRSGEWLGYEALVRWHHPKDGWISPGRFIPAAERAGMIHHVGEQVLEQAGRQFRQWRDEGVAPEWLAVNIAAPQMETPGWGEQLLAFLNRFGLAPEDLELEITERLLVERRTEVATELAYLRRHGVRVAVDDFGTGYSSLNYLTELPVDRIKIDRAFIADLTEDPRKVAVVEAIVTLGQRLGIAVLAEGVETEAQRQVLLDVGCRQGQGFLFARPAPA
ncbi:putative bifunctional diguanylate cyclase/phosphodiesterase [Halorhodospira halophila]|uniref:Diguanylate cyclase/phosphodiesterase n=1 Tax=Halorhodospira halophila (strain DSM 244 / SL1) TaxID=349124 RepID=A1WTZ5_HALHL|nr:EAL domain-containing protein [Halorhodospira halophila]ABM61157.1 diguanylate cyclase/phosphodiesterase [Halorhodospira halophila SL1]MBK1729650.1 GGDEF-domain containing protein [Halorhodospira halophila]